MGFKLYKIFIKCYKKFSFLCHFLFKKLSYIIWFIYSTNRRTILRAEMALIKFNKKIARPFVIIHYYFFLYKRRYYDEKFCIFVERIWWISGARWFFYKKMKYWFFTDNINFFWYFLPPWIQQYVTRKYWAIRIFIWYVRIKKNNFRWNIYCFLQKYGKLYKKSKKYKDNKFKYFFLVFLYAFVFISFIGFYFINIVRKWFFLIKKRVIFFIMSSIKYFILYLKFRWYFFFLEHFRKFNLHMNRKKLKWKVYLPDERFDEISDFYYIIFNFFVNSIKRAKNIFIYYKFRKDLEFYGSGQRKKWYETNAYYNLLFSKLVKKKYKKYKSQRYVFWLKNLRLYRINYNFFYFYKFFFFVYNFFYSNLVNILDMYLDIYLNFIIYLAS